MDSNMIKVNNVTYMPVGLEWKLSVPEYSLGKGEFVGIIGPNGSGKSTFLRIAAGILAPDIGTVSLMGDDIRRMDRRSISKKLGFLTQNTYGGENLSAWQIVSIGRYAHLSGAGFLTAHDREVVNACMRTTETLELSDRFFSRLSGGERQRVLLASILAQEPKVLLLDEPDSALDLHHKARFFNLLSDLAGKGYSVMVVTHDINTASAFCDRLSVMSDGVIHKDGTPHEVLTGDLLSDIYGDELKVAPNPITGNLSVYFASSGSRGSTS